MATGSVGGCGGTLVWWVSVDEPRNSVRVGGFGAEAAEITGCGVTTPALAAEAEIRWTIWSLTGRVMVPMARK